MNCTYIIIVCILIEGFSSCSSEITLSEKTCTVRPSPSKYLTAEIF